MMSQDKSIKDVHGGRGDGPNLASDVRLEHLPKTFVALLKFVQERELIDEGDKGNRKNLGR